MDAFVPSHFATPLPAPRPHTLPHLLCCRPSLFAPTSPVPRRRRNPSCISQSPPNAYSSETQRQPEPTTPESEPSPQDAASSAEEDAAKAADADTVANTDPQIPDVRELFTPAGQAGCSQCTGKGEIACPVCSGDGFFSLTMMDTTSSVQCRMCRGQRIVPCPTCRQVVYKSVVWWDQIPPVDEDPEENWRIGPDGQPRFPWSEPPAS